MFSHYQQLQKRGKADVLIVPFLHEKKGAVPAFPVKELDSFSDAPVKMGDFKGKTSEISLLYSGGDFEPRLMLLGLGDVNEVTLETLRRAYAAALKFCLKKKITSLNCLVPEVKALEEKSIVRGIAEGIVLSNYCFDKLKSDSLKKDATTLVKKVGIVGAEKGSFAAAVAAEKLAGGIYLARDLANGNADDVTPQYLGKTAKEIASKFTSVKATVFDKKRIIKEKMGLLLAVNQGSDRDPAFIVLQYRGDPKSKDHTVVVGKGITYDTGGLNIKPTGFMETMKCDMSGSAAALGTILACAALKLKKNVTAVIPSTENGIDSRSYKPGDVYRSYSGKSVEITNTDAEGRLVLADALAWTCKNLKPTRIIDFATLTGAVVVALGEEVTGLMSSDDVLAEKLFEAGETTFERVWRLPLYKEYREMLKSDIADIMNCVTNRQAGTITAALFLQEFVDKDVPWAHCDIAGTAYLKSNKRYHPKNGTGVGVRLMVEFLEKL